MSGTVSTFHDSSSLVKPLKKSLLSLQDVSDIFFGQLPGDFSVKRNHLHVLIRKPSSLERG